jgi:beta-glucosidase
MNMVAGFPVGFVWGTATAAYQIEGAVDEDGRGPSIWDTFVAEPGRIANGDTGAVACDHYHRYAEDVDLMAALGVSAYRFSIAWPRIQPDGAGAANPKGLDFYRRLIERLRDRGITPYVTLYHWDLPQALQDTGGWPARDTAYRFADYAAIVRDGLGDLVQHWITLNEPKVASHAGYGAGIHAPGIRDPAQCEQATHHLLLAHDLASRVLENAGHVGIVLDLSPVDPFAASDRPAAQQLDADLHVEDPQRVDYLRRHLLAVREAIDAGVDVRGYFVWTLMDNFEWAEGYSAKFGLFAVEPDQRRVPRASARFFAHVASTNMLAS